MLPLFSTADTTEEDSEHLREDEVDYKKDSYSEQSLVRREFCLAALSWPLLYAGLIVI